MKLQFKKQTYQAASVEAVVDCFQGQTKSTGVKYRVDPGRAKDPQQSLPSFDELSGFKNASIAVPLTRVLENIQSVLVTVEVCPSSTFLAVEYLHPAMQVRVLAPLLNDFSLLDREIHRLTNWL